MNAVVDTNMFMDGLDFSKYNKIWLVSTVIEELDKKKRDRFPEVAYKARQAIRDIQEAEEQGKIEFRKSYTCTLDLDLTIPDNRILVYAKDICAFDKEAVLVTADKAVYLKANGLDIPCEYVDFDKPNCDSYTGYREIKLTDKELADFYCTKTNMYDMKENEYLIIRDSTNEVIDKFKWTNNKGFVNLYRKAFDSIALDKFKARDAYQECAMDSLMNSDFTLLTGAAGTSKTLMSLSYILQEVLSGNRNKVVIVYNQVNMRGTAGVGFLPGSAIAKMIDSPLGSILSSKLGSVLAVEQLVLQGKLLLIPASGVRGIEIGQNDILFCTESQNTNSYLMKTILQRPKEGCKIIIEGDIDDQVDLDCFTGKQNGIRRAIEIFAGKKVFSYVKLKNIYRGQVATIAQDM